MIIAFFLQKFFAFRYLLHQVILGHVYGIKCFSAGSTLKEMLYEQDRRQDDQLPQCPSPQPQASVLLRAFSKASRPSLNANHAMPSDPTTSMYPMWKIS